MWHRTPSASPQNNKSKQHKNAGAGLVAHVDEAGQRPLGVAAALVLEDVGHVLRDAGGRGVGAKGRKAGGRAG